MATIPVPPAYLPLEIAIEPRPKGEQEKLAVEALSAANLVAAFVAKAAEPKAAN